MEEMALSVWEGGVASRKMVRSEALSGDVSLLGSPCL